MGREESPQERPTSQTPSPSSLTLGSCRLVSCSRWAEVVDTVRFHAGLAEAVGIPTEFRLLNGAPPLILGRGTDDGTAHRSLMEFMERSPGLSSASDSSLLTVLSPHTGGGTPMCGHITQVVEQVRVMEPVLRANAQKAVVIIITDGEASDGDVMQALRPLQNLPVWLVIRLCTSEADVVRSWNLVETNLEVELDVLDDLVGEATEIHRFNKWVTYGEPLHRIREWGVQVQSLPPPPLLSLPLLGLRSKTWTCSTRALSPQSR